jgi:hypothetical protein
MWWHLQKIVSTAGIANLGTRQERNKDLTMSVKNVSNRAPVQAFALYSRIGLRILVP